jgi:hypothetical protein
MLEVALREPSCRSEQLADLTLQGARDEDGRGQGQEQEGEQDRADQQPAVRDRALEVRGLVEDHDPGRRAHRLGNLLSADPIVDPLRFELVGAERWGLLEPLHRGAQRLCAIEHGHLEAGEAADLADVVAGLRYRDRKDSDRVAVGTGQAQAGRSHALARAHELTACGGPEVDRGDGRVGPLELADPDDRVLAVAACHRSPQPSIARNPPQGPARTLGCILVDRERGADPGCDAGVGLARLALRGQAQEHECEGDHRDDHDQREEDP